METLITRIIITLAICLPLTSHLVDTFGLDLKGEFILSFFLGLAVSYSLSKL